MTIFARFADDDETEQVYIPRGDMAKIWRLAMMIHMRDETPMRHALQQSFETLMPVMQEMRGEEGGLLLRQGLISPDSDEERPPGTILLTTPYGDTFAVRSDVEITGHRLEKLGAIAARKSHR